MTKKYEKYTYKDYDLLPTHNAIYKIDRAQPPPPIPYKDLRANGHIYRFKDQEKYSHGQKTRKTHTSGNTTQFWSNINKLNYKRCSIATKVPSLSCRTALISVLSMYSRSSVNCPPFYAYVRPRQLDIHMAVPHASHISLLMHFDELCKNQKLCYKWEGSKYDKTRFESQDDKTRIASKDDKNSFGSQDVSNYICIDTVLQSLNVSTKTQETGAITFSKNKQPFTVNIYSYGRNIVSRATSGIRYMMSTINTDKSYNISHYVNNIRKGSLNKHFGLQALSVFPTDSNGVFYHVILNDVSCLHKTLKNHVNMKKDTNITFKSYELDNLRSALTRDRMCLPSLV